MASPVTQSMSRPECVPPHLAPKPDVMAPLIGHAKPDVSTVAEDKDAGALGVSEGTDARALAASCWAISFASNLNGGGFLT